MRIPSLALLAALAAAPTPARAQRANRSISLESAASSPGGRPEAAELALAAGASWWLEGDVHGTARLAWGAAGRTAGRAVASTAGLAWTPGTAGVRPRLFAEAGWAWTWSGAGAARGEVALAAGAGLDWFLARDVALTLGAALHRPSAAPLELRVGVRIGF